MMVEFNHLAISAKNQIAGRNQKHTSVLSAPRINVIMDEIEAKSFTCNRNNRDPSIEP